MLSPLTVGRTLFSFAASVCFVVCGTFGTAASLQADDATTVAAGLNKWNETKLACGGNYSYVVSRSYAFGPGNITTITVQNNRVVAREFQQAIDHVAPGEFKGTAEQEVGWQETATDLGSHKDGAPAKTLDELYAEVTAIASRQLAQAEKRYVKRDRDGLLVSCFIVNTLIADDAPIDGVNIAAIHVGTADSHDPDALHNLKSFPKELDGLSRHVILLLYKERGAEHDFQVQLIVGKRIQTDGVNHYRLHGQVDKQTLKGFGFDFYRVTGCRDAASTRIGVPPGQKPVESFIEIPRTLIAYNSRLPIVVYAPQDVVVKYRIFSAGKTNVAETR